jgi:hypothetical protein
VLKTVKERQELTSTLSAGGVTIAPNSRQSGGYHGNDRRMPMLTGRRPIRSGTTKVVWGQLYGMTQWEVTMAEMLSEHGYGSDWYRDPALTLGYRIVMSRPMSDATCLHCSILSEAEKWTRSTGRSRSYVNNKFESMEEI